MSKSLHTVCLALVLGAVWAALPVRAGWAQEFYVCQSTAEKKIAEALASPTELEFMETPLEDMVAFLRDLHCIEIQFDQRALDDAAIPADSPITRCLVGTSLRSGLRLVLRDLDLTYLIRDEVLLITTEEGARECVSTRVYRLTDLGIRIEEWKLGQLDPDSIVEALVDTIEPDSWRGEGGQGAIAVVSLGEIPVLVITQSYAVHEKILELLDKLHAAVVMEASFGNAIRQTAAPKKDRRD